TRALVGPYGLLRDSHRLKRWALAGAERLYKIIRRLMAIHGVGARAAFCRTNSSNGTRFLRASHGPAIERHWSHFREHQKLSLDIACGASAAADEVASTQQGIGTYYRYMPLRPEAKFKPDARATRAARPVRTQDRIEGKASGPCARHLRRGRFAADVP